MEMEVVGKYALGKVLGTGDFDSRTRLCTHTVTGAQYAVKIYDKEVLASYAWMWEQVRDSVHIMRTLPKHENLIEMVECFETKSSLYILMQIHTPKRVSRIYSSEGPPVPMFRTKYMFIQTVRGILHLHANNVAHLGLAPDHIMVNEKWQVKIGNLVSCRSINSDLITDLRGTTRTVAPEVLSGTPYDPRQADVWALGVVLYFMVASGRYPHDGANTTKHILGNKIRPLPEGVDPDARDLIHRLLQMNPRRRPAVSDILSHPFFSDMNDGDLSGEEYGMNQQSDDFSGSWGSGSDHGKRLNLENALSKGVDSSSSSPNAQQQERNRRASGVSTDFGSERGSPRPPRPPSTTEGSSLRASKSLVGAKHIGVRAYWSEKEGLSIAVPEGLPKDEEAAYLIQHTYRLYKLKREEHWDLNISRKGRLGQLLRIKRIPNVSRDSEAGSGGSQQGKRKKSFSFGVAERHLASRRGKFDDDGHTDTIAFGDEFGAGAMSAVFDSSIRVSKDIAPITSHHQRHSKMFSPSFTGGDLLSRPQTATSTVSGQASVSLTSPMSARLGNPDEQKGFMLGFQQGLMMAQQQLLAAQHLVERAQKTRRTRRSVNKNATETHRTSHINVPRNNDHEASSEEDGGSAGSEDETLSRSQSRGITEASGTSSHAPLGAVSTAQRSSTGFTPPKNLHANRPPSLSPRFIEHALAMTRSSALPPQTNNTSVADFFNASGSTFLTPFAMNGVGTGTPMASGQTFNSNSFAGGMMGFGSNFVQTPTSATHQCLACGRSPQSRVVTTGRRPFPSTPFSYSTQKNNGGKSEAAAYTRLTEEEQVKLHQDSIMRQRPLPPAHGSPSSSGRRASLGGRTSTIQAASPRLRGSASNETLNLPAISR